MAPLAKFGDFIRNKLFVGKWKYRYICTEIKNTQKSKSNENDNY